MATLPRIYPRFTDHLVHPWSKTHPVHIGELLTLKKVAACLGLSTATVRKLCGRGALPYVRIGNSLRVNADDLADFIAAKTS